MSPPSVFALAAGGTGGHLFPAEALASELQRRGHVVHLLTDPRGHQFATAFPDGHTHVVPSETLRGRSIMAFFRMAAAIISGIFASRRILRVCKAEALVAFGGYPSVPPGLAAASLGVPVMLHEQNAVMGRANRILAGRSRVIATGFQTVAKLPTAAASRCQLTGNPVRPAILAGQTPYSAPDENGQIRLLVFGGSQGAMIFSRVVPDAIAQLSSDLQKRILLVQQCRPEDLDRVRDTYTALGIEAELNTFFSDMPERLAAAHLIVARAGASTVGELATMGRPSILIPLPGAIDQDQKANAGVLERGGAAVMIVQDEFSPESLAKTLEGLITMPNRLAEMAAAARTSATDNAAERLADLAESLVADRKDSQS